MTMVNNTLVTFGREGKMKFWKYGYHLDLLLELMLPVNNSVVKSVLFCCEGNYASSFELFSIEVFILLWAKIEVYILWPEY